jgi:hypothetical protein
MTLRSNEMKKARIGLLVAFSLALVFASCNSPASAADAPEIAPALSKPYTGDGGEGMSIAILAPKATGLAGNQDYLPALVQGEFVSNFTGYSALSVLDREQLFENYKELTSSGFYDEAAAAGSDWGHLTPPDYLLRGTILKTATGYALQIGITRTAVNDKSTAASYSGTCTFFELDNLAGVRRASLELFQQLGIQLTARAKTELAGAAREQTVAAQTADARGFTADKGGRTAEAAIYYTQAAAIDPSMLQTASRASTLTATIASGSIGAGTRELIQQSKDWRALLTETEETIYNLIRSASENPPYALYYSNDIKWGDINYQTESRDARFETNLRGRAYWFESVRIAAQSVYGAVYDGLTKTGHKDEWGFGNWPGTGVTRNNPFSTPWRHDFNVVFELVNEQGKAIGRQTYSRRAEYGLRRDGNQISLAYTADDFATVSFNAVKAADISDSGMSIRVASVNNAPPEQAAFQITMIPDWEANANSFLLFENSIVTGFRSGVDASRYQNLVIPATHWAEQVIAVGDNAFKGKLLSSVVIPDGVTSIGEEAFEDSNLTSVTIPANIQMGKDAFNVNHEYYNSLNENDRFDTVYNSNGKQAGTYELKFNWSAFLLKLVPLIGEGINPDEWILVE